MAGGIGTRFWPMSRISRPKQFIDILGTGETLLQQTFRRFLKVCPSENIFIVTNELYKELIITQIPAIDSDNILCEPNRRNTAPCIAYASYKIKKQNPDAIMVVAPSDHIILNEETFSDVILSALKAAENNKWLITLGITPSRPETGYGYIQFCSSKPYPQDERIRKVKTFTEKPSLEVAEVFLQSGDFLWNSGLFIWSIESITEAFEKYLPEVANEFIKGNDSYFTPAETEFIRITYENCVNISIDYAVMEKADNVYVLASDFGWSDLGTWGSLFEIREKDANNNTIVGKNVLTYESYGCIVHVPKDKLVVIEGLENYIVVEDNNMLLICKKADEQNLRHIVNDVKIEKGEKFIY